MRAIARRTLAYIILAVTISAAPILAAELPAGQPPSKPDWAQFKADLIRYRAQVFEIKTSADTQPANILVQNYLGACVNIADSCLAALAENPKRVMDIPAIEAAIKQRNDQQRILMDNFLMSDPLVRQEIKAYKDILFPYMEVRYLGVIRARNALWEGKYFADWDKEGNFLEAWLNSHTPLTSFSIANQLNPPNYGVSPWEFTVRAEPIVLLDTGHEAAALFAVGCLYNVFPRVEIKDNGEIESSRDFFSNYLAKFGPRLGVGTTFNSPHDVYLAGGVQIRAWSIWYVYNAADYTWAFAIGLSDWSWIKEFLPYFGLE